jgi:hypothetical protein
MSVVLWVMYIELSSRSVSGDIKSISYINVAIRNVYASSDENWHHICHYMSCHHTKANVMLYGISSDESWLHRYHCLGVPNTLE